MDEWLDALRAACARSSQRKVAEQLGVSPAMVNQVLKGAYSGDLDRMRRLVEGRYLNQTVHCPVLGEIPLDKCQWHQEREFGTGNPQRVQLYRACRSGCPHSKLPQTLPGRSQQIAVTTLEPDPKRYPLEQRLAQLASEADSPEQHLELLTRELRQLANRLNGLLFDRKHHRRS